MILIYPHVFISKSKRDKKYIFLFTNNDLPHSKFSDKHKQAERRFGDLQDDDVSVFLFPIGDHFDPEKLYKVGFNPLLLHI